MWRWDQQEPFGVTVPDENPSALGVFEFPLRFAGQYMDKETGLFFNYFRDYDPSIGRYEQSDPLGLKAGLNTYVYVVANPLLLVDPTGLAWGGMNQAGYMRKRPPAPKSVCGTGYFRGPEFAFRQACINHDQCYDTCGATQHECDATFCQQVRASCLPGDYGCQAAATTYCFLVLVFGGSAYYSAQT